MQTQASIFWFRQDFRLTDNPGLLAAANLGPVLPIYILDNSSTSMNKMGKNSKLYLHYALQQLSTALQNNLNVYIGTPKIIILQLIQQYNIQHVFWNHCYEPWYIAADKELIQALEQAKICHTVCNASYLWAHNAVIKEDATYYKVFTAYKRKAVLLPPRKPVAKPENLLTIKDHRNTTNINQLQLSSQDSSPNIIEQYWTVGESHAYKKLNEFLQNYLSGYKQYRDYPARSHTSQLSAHLHFGEISPQQIWHTIQTMGALYAHENDWQHFLSEVIWREFSCYLLAHFPKLETDNFQAKFNAFPWQHNAANLHAWQTGKTGYPLVDAGMRELLATGYMHNRVRMIVASFLVKNLLIHWHYGRDWFWQHLVDADLANNSASWQWVAGCGVDAAPYFRIFNPITQGEKFDADGQYTKKFVPELAQLPTKYLFQPWTASEKILNNAGVMLGSNYPNPIVDFKQSRIAALSAYQRLP
jgi:deoxyribodipyrimidine photo-lyase